MIEVRITDREVASILEIVRDLRSQNLVQGQDFDFEYHQSKWNLDTGHIDNYTIFRFYEEKYATYLSLKYGFK